MNKRETGLLLAYVIGACPQQQVNDLTPDAWHDILGHLEYAECREAARAVAARQPFVAPAEIIREIADRRCAEKPQSAACRGGDCRGCQVSWCCHTCHPRAVDYLAGPQQPHKPALPPREASAPVQLADAMKAIGRSPDP
jgi:hypothetical protein